MKNDLDVILIGCGGTGSFLAPSILRSIAELNSVNELECAVHPEYLKPRINVLFIDGDIVETKNITRQNFAACDVDQYKAAVLANRYGGNFGVEVNFLTDYLTLINLESLIRHLHGAKEASKARNIYDARVSDKVFISCVDNIHCRALVSWLVQLYAYNSDNTYWIDAGNELNFGQVYLNSCSNPINHTSFFTSNIEVVKKIFDVPDPELACENGGAQSSLANRVSASAADVIFSAILAQYKADESRSVPLSLGAHAIFNNTSFGNLVLENLVKDRNNKLHPTIEFSSMMSGYRSGSRKIKIPNSMNAFEIAALSFLEDLGQPNSRKEVRRLRKLYKRCYKTSKVLKELYGKYHH